MFSHKLLTSSALFTYNYPTPNSCEDRCEVKPRLLVIRTPFKRNSLSLLSSSPAARRGLDAFSAFPFELPTYTSNNSVIVQKWGSAQSLRPSLSPFDSSQVLFGHNGCKMSEIGLVCWFPRIPDRRPRNAGTERGERKISERASVCLRRRPSINNAEK